jgi:Signal transduction histidine kinase
MPAPTGGVDGVFPHFQEPGDVVASPMMESPLRDPATPVPSELTRDILRAIDEERERLAREIHDNLAQDLFALRLLAESIARSADGDRPVLAQRLADLAGRVEQTARDLAHSYSPRAGSGGNFLHAVRTLAKRHEDRVTFDLTGISDTLLEVDTASHLFHIVQEAVTNAIRHGSASRIRVALQAGSSPRVLEIEDNGSGFEPGQTGEGLGLRTMAYRASQIGGSFQVKRNPGGGMRVLCEFPPEG